MKNLRPNTRKKIGLAPGSLVYTGTATEGISCIRLWDYTKDTITQKEVPEVKDLEQALKPETNSWVQFTGIHDVKRLKAVGDFFDIHPLVLEDILNTHHRPKIETVEDGVFVTLKFLNYDTKKKDLRVQQVSFFGKKHFLISFHEHEHEQDIFLPILERLGNDKSRLRKYGIGYLLYALVDVLVDHYSLTLEQLSEELEDVDQRLFHDVSEQMLTHLHTFKKEFLVFQKHTLPLREMTITLREKLADLDGDHMQTYSQDLTDHILGLQELLKTYSDMLNSMFDMYFSLVGVKTNRIMQTLTVMTVIFLPLTLIAGIYGMNFERMPELVHPYGYPAVIGAMVVLAGGIWLWLRRKKWL